MNSHDNGSMSRWRSLLRRRSAEEDLVAYRRLALQLHHDLAAAGDEHSVLLVSPTRSSASARGSILLACCAAEELRCRVLLVDPCERHPATTRLLGVDGCAGFAELRRGTPEPWKRLVLPTAQENVFFFPAGTVSRLSQGPPVAIDTFLREADRRFGLVVLSGGSVLEDSAASAIAPLAGCVLLAVVENETRLADLDAAQETLELCGARKIGLLMTNHVRREILAFRGDKRRTALKPE